MYKLKLRDKLRRAWLFVLCACALTALQACGGSSSEKTVETHAQGFVSTSAPMVNTTLNFYAAANKSEPQVEGSPIGIGTSNVNGLFVASVFLPSQVLDSNNWPTTPVNFRVTASGGTMNGSPVKGVLRADVRNYQSGQTVYVNAVTTLVAAYWDATPGITLADAETAVGKFLGLPAAALGSAYVPYDAASFSQVTFEKQVATQLTLNGSQTNINTYIASLLVEMKANPTATHRFVAAPSVPATSGCNAVVAQLSTGPKVTASACASLTTGSASGVPLPAVKTLISKFVGEGLSTFFPGVPGKLAGSVFDFAFSFVDGPKPEDPNNIINKKLDEIKVSLLEMKNIEFATQEKIAELNRLGHQNEYQAILTRSAPYLIQIASVLNQAVVLATYTQEVGDTKEEFIGKYEDLRTTYKRTLATLFKDDLAKISLQSGMVGLLTPSDGLIIVGYNMFAGNGAFYNNRMSADYAKIIDHWESQQALLMGMELANAKINTNSTAADALRIINKYIGKVSADGTYDNTKRFAVGTYFGNQDAKIPNQLPLDTLYDRRNNLLIKDSTFQPEINAYKYLYITPGAGAQAGEVSNLFDQNKKLADGWRLPTPDEATAIFKGWKTGGNTPAEWAIAQGWPTMNVFLYKSTPQVNPYTALVPSSAFKMATSETLQKLVSHVNFVKGRSFNMETGNFEATSSWVQMRRMAKDNNGSFSNESAWFDSQQVRDTVFSVQADGWWGGHLDIGTDPGNCTVSQHGWVAVYSGDNHGLNWRVQSTPCEVVTDYNKGYGSDIVNLIPVHPMPEGAFYVPQGVNVPK